jgi:cell division protein FtsW
VNRAGLYAGADPVLAGLGLALVLLGLVAITSASIGYAEAQFGNPWHHAERHGLYIVAALVLALVVYRVPPRFWYDSAWLWLLLSLALLALVLVPGVGKSVNGSQRWLPLGPLTLQPSELVKGASVLFLAGYLVRQQAAVRSTWQGFLRPMLVLGVIALLLLFEPDFGATVIVMATAFGMLFLAGMKLLHFFIVIGLSLFGLAALIISAPYRLQRLTAYTDPWADPYDTGFQLIQSLIAFGRGEWLGVGLGNSVQKLFYLPEAHTDFVFSIWAEETGFVGAALLIGLVLALILRIGFVGRAAARAGEDFAAYVCFGVALIFAGQAFINMGASSGLLPTKGLTLPFVSYGGTALVASCCLLAIVLRIEHDLRAGAGARAGGAR